jgi:hypothetical protein
MRFVVFFPAKTVKPGRRAKAHVRILPAESGTCQAVLTVIFTPEKSFRPWPCPDVYIFDFKEDQRFSWRAVCKVCAQAWAGKVPFPKVTARASVGGTCKTPI